MSITISNYIFHDFFLKSWNESSCECFIWYLRVRALIFALWQNNNGVKILPFWNPMVLQCLYGCFLREFLEYNSWWLFLRLLLLLPFDLCVLGFDFVFFVRTGRQFKFGLFVRHIDWLYLRYFPSFMQIFQQFFLEAQLRVSAWCGNDVIRSYKLIGSFIDKINSFL